LVRWARTNGAGFSRDKRFATPHCAAMRRILPLLLLLALGAGGFALVHDVGWSSLAQHQETLHAWVAAHPIGSAAAYLLIYTATAALSLPHAAVLTVAGGLLFGAGIGCALTVAGATIGASILLVVVRAAFTGTLDRQRQRIPESVRDRLATDGFSYLLALRFMPIFPFWLVNLAAAVAGVRLVVFVPATLIGIAPASFILGSIGAGVGSVLAEGRSPDLSVMFSARMLLPFFGLAVLSLLPVLLRRRSGAHA
jgi:uncharacterized membrane protein YdjX (TVP38/TMEM64 family)